MFENYIKISIILYVFSYVLLVYKYEDWMKKLCLRCNTNVPLLSERILLRDQCKCVKFCVQQLLTP